MVLGKGKVKGLLALLIAAALVAAVSAGLLAQRPADDAVATVNGETITERELYEEMLRRTGQQVLDQMVTERLIRQAVAAADVEVSDEAVQAEMDRVKEQLGEDVTLEEALARAGLTEEEWAAEIRLELGLRQLLTDRVQITEDEMKAFFEQYKDFLGTEEQVRVSHILVDSREEAEAIRAALLEGADFAEVAREKSADPGTAVRGGDLGWVSRGQTVKPFEDMAFSSPVGDISPVVETDFGFHVLKVEERREAREAVYEESRDVIHSYLLEDKLQQAFQEWLREIRNEARVEIFL